MFIITWSHLLLQTLLGTSVYIFKSLLRKLVNLILKWFYCHLWAKSFSLSETSSTGNFILRIMHVTHPISWALLSNNSRCCFQSSPPFFSLPSSRTSSMVSRSGETLKVGSLYRVLLNLIKFWEICRMFSKQDLFQNSCLIFILNMVQSLAFGWKTFSL